MQYVLLWCVYMTTFISLICLFSVCLQDDIHKSFDVSLYNAPSSYKIGVVVYVVSIALLLYFLADNVLAKSRLTPRRIKHW